MMNHVSIIIDNFLVIVVVIVIFVVAVVEVVIIIVFVNNTTEYLYVSFVILHVKVLVKVQANNDEFIKKFI
jgi:hypothetical protein